MNLDCHTCGRPGHWRLGEQHVTHRDAPPCPLPPRDIKHPVGTRRRRRHLVAVGS